MVRKLPDLKNNIKTLPPFESKYISRVPFIAAFIGPTASGACLCSSMSYTVGIYGLLYGQTTGRSATSRTHLPPHQDHDIIDMIVDVEDEIFQYF
jgi:hypothetical protein